VYWYGNISRKQLLCIKSYLKTQNLEKTKLWVWLDYKTYTEKNINLIPKHQNIEIKKYVPNIEAKNTLFENKKFINNTKYLKFRSDLARIIFLYKYGGLYFDLDMILLKDFMPLLGLEFCYTWSLKKSANNGLLRFFKNSSICKKIMQKYIDLLKDYHNDYKYNVNIIHKYIYNDNLNILCLPCVLFDPVWMLFDKKEKSKYCKLNNFDDFFKSTNENINDFFDNQIFAYHWHSRNNANIEKNSYFEKLEFMLK